MRKPQGIVIYDGPSMIDGKPIICIVTGFRKTKNPKTGQMLQSWIMRKDKNPCDALINGHDYSVCGDCKHRKWGTCYVAVNQAPNNVWKAFKNGRYDELSVKNAHFLVGQKMRMGAYGEPVAMPFEVWESLMPYFSGHTGYTHQWRKCDARFKKILMASVDTEKEAKKAKSLGWRTFRVLLDKDDKLLPNEYHCPAAESGHATTCEKCGACAGKMVKGKHPVIVIHGKSWKTNNFRVIMRLRKQKKKYTDHLPKYLKS